jgi:hypothetical protein
VSNLVRLLTAGAISIVLSLAFCVSASAEVKTFQSPLTQATFVELYTSEGCSSCPTADRWFSSLRNQEGLWEEFVPVAFHVSYWNRLGWVDRLSTDEYTNRQRALIRYLKGNSVYTPCVIRNGKEWRGWYQGERLRSSGQPVGLLEVRTAEPHQYEAHFRPLVKNSSGWSVQAALLGFGISTDVKSGENRGKVLKHDFTVLDLSTDHDLDRVDDVFQTTFALIPPSDIEVQAYGIAVWVTQKNSPVAVQAVGGYL